MHILVVNPNTTRSMTEKIGRAARSVAASTTTISAVSAASGLASIEGFHDEALCAPAVVAAIRDGERAGCDGFVIACFDDPGLDAARTVATGPVVGIAEAAMHAAALIACSFTIITTLPQAIPTIQHLALRYGFERKLCRVRAGGFRVLDLEEPGSTARTLLEREIEQAIDDERPEAILLGCAGMADLARDLTQQYRLPVIDGVAAAVKLVEALVGLGLGTSRAGGYASPLAKS